MHFVLNPYELADTAQWMEQSFREAVAHVRRMCLDMIRDLDRCMEAPITLEDSPEALGVHTPVGKAEEVLRIVTAGVYNMSLQRVTGRAGDLDRVRHAQMALEQLMAKLPEEAALAIRQVSAAEVAQKRRAREKFQAKRDKQEAEACEASVYRQMGRTGIWGRCQNKATQTRIIEGAEPSALPPSMRVCAVHAKQAHVRSYTAEKARF